MPKSVLEILREKRAALRAELDALLAEDRELTTDEETRADELMSQLESTDRRDREIVALEVRDTELAEQRAADGIPVDTRTEHAAPAHVVREERTYTAHKDTNGSASFLSDQYRAWQGDPDAQARLIRHMTEARVEGEISETRATNTASFAGAIVPQYLTNLAALVARNGRPFANACTGLPLPDQGAVFQIPRGTTGAATAIQATENSNVQSTDEVWANLTLNLSTIAGQQDVSRQALERGIPGLDSLIYLDLAGAYAANLDTQVISGSGASGQLLGIFNTGGVNQATAFGAAATASTFHLKLAGAVNSIESAGTIVAPANIIVMHPRRFSWLLGQVDTQGRPLITPVANGLQLMNGFGVDANPGAYSGDSVGGTGVDFNGYVVKGYLQGLPVVTDANVQTAQGSGPEDIVYVANTAHLLLFEQGNGQPNQLRFEQTLGNQLTVKLVVYGYVAFTAGRYPTAVSLIGGNATVGNGLVAPSF
jgi:HK97 family phage major capsid protein